MTEKTEPTEKGDKAAGDSGRSSIKSSDLGAVSNPADMFKHMRGDAKATAQTLVRDDQQTKAVASELSQALKSHDFSTAAKNMGSIIEMADDKADAIKKINQQLKDSNLLPADTSFSGVDEKGNFQLKSADGKTIAFDKQGHGIGTDQTHYVLSADADGRSRLERLSLVPNAGEGGTIYYDRLNRTRDIVHVDGSHTDVDYVGDSAKTSRLTDVTKDATNFRIVAWNDVEKRYVAKESDGSTTYPGNVAVGIDGNVTTTSHDHQSKTTVFPSGGFADYQTKDFENGPKEVMTKMITAGKTSQFEFGYDAKTGELNQIVLPDGRNAVKQGSGYALEGETNPNTQAWIKIAATGYALVKDTEWAEHLKLPMVGEAIDMYELVTKPYIYDVKFGTNGELMMLGENNQPVTFFPNGAVMSGFLPDVPEQAR